MAVRVTPPVVDNYSRITSRPSDIFQQINLEPQTDQGVTSYDNAELIQAISEVYTFAQQSASYLMPLFDQSTMRAAFVKQDTFNKVQWRQKTEESPITPLYVPSGGTRAYSVIEYHQGFQISPIAQANRRYALFPRAQMQLAMALGRLYDLGIIWALTAGVLKYESTSSKTFKGLATPTMYGFPTFNQFLVGSSTSGTAAKKPGQTFYDDIVEYLENRNLDPNACWIIGGPKLRRHLKDINAFRNLERSNVYMGAESARYFRWNDLNFVIMGPETQPTQSMFGTIPKFHAAGVQAITDAVAKQKDLNATNSYPGGTANDVSYPGLEMRAAQANTIKTASGAGAPATGITGAFVVADFSGLTWGTAPFSERTRTSERDDYSYTPQLYTAVGFGGMRIDDNKVGIGYYGDAA